MSGGSNHSTYAYSLLPTYYVGVLGSVATAPATVPKVVASQTSATPKPVVVPPTPTKTPVTPVTSSFYTTTQVSAHNKQTDCWIIISNKVYNVTSFMASHPGGVSAIANRCGTDSTNVFTTSAGHAHSSYAYSLLPTYFVSNLDTTVVKPVVNDTTAPSVPTGLSVSSISTSQINLSWSASTDSVGVTGYKIYRNGVYFDSVVSTSYSNTNLSPSTSYSYTVSAYDAAGNNSAQTASKSATTDAPPVVQTPTNGSAYTTAQVATHNVQSNCWIIILGKIYNVTSFMASHPGGVSAIANRCGTDSTNVFTTSAWHAHSSYAYSLLPTYYVGDVGTNAPVVTTDTTAPTVPTGLTATAISSSQINLTWTASTDANVVSGYKIYRGGVQVGTSGSASYSDTGLSANTVYTYTVSAYDGNSNNSAQSTSKSATTNSAASTVTPAPTGTTYTATQVAAHNIQSDCWIIISNKIYNVTSFMASHPGGITAIRTRCGTDSTSVFTTSAGHVHSAYAYSLLPTYYVADLAVSSTPSPTPTPTPTPTPSGTSVTYTVNVNSSGNYDVTSLTLKAGDKINFVYTAPRSGEVKTTFSPAGISSVTLDREVTQKSRTFNTVGTWTFNVIDHSGNTGTVVVQ